MARKKPAPPPKHISDVFYAYYDVETKQLLSITNEKINLYKDYLEVDYDTYERLVSGKEKFSDYLLGLVKEGETTSLQLISAVEQAYNFKNTMLEVVTENSVKDPELLVEWNGPKKEWNFFLSAAAKSRLTVKLDNAKVLFFIILENDYDFLIRTIIIDSNDLFSKQCIGVAFESDFELKIDKINIATKLIFESQKLRIINDNN